MLHYNGLVSIVAGSRTGKWLQASSLPDFHLEPLLNLEKFYVQRVIWSNEDSAVRDCQITKENIDTWEDVEEKYDEPSLSLGLEKWSFRQKTRWKVSSKNGTQLWSLLSTQCLRTRNVYNIRPEKNWDKFFKQFFPKRANKWIILNVFLKISLDLKISYIMPLISRVYV